MPVSFEQEGRLARIVLARPPLNVLDLDHLGAFADAAERGARGQAAVLLLRAAEDCRAFSAGNDVADHAPEHAPPMLERFHRAVRALRETDAITVAEVRGAAFGGGCELVAACDLAVAAPDARFGQPEIDVGCFPPVAAALLPQRIGWTRAVEMIATGRILDAGEAHRIGLVTRLAPDANGLVAELLAKSPEVLRCAKAALRGGTLERAERIYEQRLLPLADCAEGVRAFLEKRPPDWEA